MTVESPEISIQNPGRYAKPGVLDIWLRKVLSDLAPGIGGFGVLLTDDEAMRELNARFRKREGPTDVLSFPGTSLAGVGEAVADGYLGDVAISIATASDQAKAHGHALERELKILLLHGILHCLGYDHDVDDGEMLRLEGELIDRWIEDAQ